MEILKYKREVNPENIEEVDKFLTRLRNLVVQYLDTCDVFVLVESKDKEGVIFEGKINSDFAMDRIHRCLVSYPPSFKIICMIRVVTRE